MTLSETLNLGIVAHAGVLECAFGHYQPIRGAIPERPRTDHNPLNRQEYLLHVARGIPGR